jgi:hypothetical protein
MMTSTYSEPNMAPRLRRSSYFISTSHHLLTFFAQTHEDLPPPLYPFIIIVAC